jgi:hypothetical protein
MNFKDYVEKKKPFLTQQFFKRSSMENVQNQEHEVNKPRDNKLRLTNIFEQHSNPQISR